MIINNKVLELLNNAKNMSPHLDANLGCTNRDYMSGEIGRGAFEYVLSRHDNVYFAVNCVDLNTGKVKEEMFENVIPENWKIWYAIQ
jgi:hypothetical protein